ncbi:hypothetical protein BGZ58_009159 [Dissophora ornata]|nr:hypothetical protein BGZ58_009159 [Dissophora ornata]
MSLNSTSNPTSRSLSSSQPPSAMALASPSSANEKQATSPLVPPATLGTHRKIYPDIFEMARILQRNKEVFQNRTKESKLRQHTPPTSASQRPTNVTASHNDPKVGPAPGTVPVTMAMHEMADMARILKGNQDMVRRKLAERKARDNGAH